MSHGPRRSYPMPHKFPIKCARVRRQPGHGRPRSNGRSRADAVGRTVMQIGMTASYDVSRCMPNGRVEMRAARPRTSAIRSGSDFNSRPSRAIGIGPDNLQTCHTVRDGHIRCHTNLQKSAPESDGSLGTDVRDRMTALEPTRSVAQSCKSA